MSTAAAVLAAARPSVPSSPYTANVGGARLSRARNSSTSIWENEQHETPCPSHYSRRDRHHRGRPQLPERMEGDRRRPTEGQARLEADGRGEEAARRRRTASQGRQALRVDGDPRQGEEDPQDLG